MSTKPLNPEASVDIKNSDEYITAFRRFTDVTAAILAHGKSGTSPVARTAQGEEWRTLAYERESLGAALSRYELGYDLLRTDEDNDE